MSETHPWYRPRLTRLRVGVALGAAVLADAMQLLLGPVGWFLADEIIDVGAMIATSLAIGLHPLLLPTFIVELLPVVDLWPTWTGCVIAVIALRRNDLQKPAGVPTDIDIRPTDVR